MGEVGRADLADEAEALAERTAQGLFYVACVGQFKRGKSTLVNALVGRPVLPVGVENPQNEKGVVAVEVSLPSPLLGVAGARALQRALGGEPRRRCASTGSAARR